MMLLHWTVLASVTLARCQTFDYVIIGGGTSGLVIANRLSEDPDVTVAVIEAGPDVRNYPNVTQTDVGDLNYINASIDWQYYSVPQERLGNRSFLYHAGKALGGTSTINGMVYLRGDAAEYDAWETLGNEGWNWGSLFPYFKRSENFTIPDAAQIAVGATYVAEYHGEDGYLDTGFPYALDDGPFYDDYLQTLSTAGISGIPDPNGGSTEGLSPYPLTLDRDADVREDAARAYYQPVEGRPNLSVIQGTVSKITWGESSCELVQATGVEYLDASGELCQLGVEKEVVVSAGTYRSPLVLEASGIGNPSILSQHDIETRVDLPGVGEGMQDQQLLTLVFTSSQDITDYLPHVTFWTAQNIFANSTVGDTTESQIPAWAQTVSEFGNGAISAEALETRFRIQHDLFFKKNITIVENIALSAPGVIGAVFWNLLPFSWGSVHLNTSSAADYPVIDPNFMAVGFDTDLLTAAGRLIRRLWSTAPLSSWVGDLAALGAPGLDATDDEWAEYILAGTGTNYHSIGTCAMLPRDLGGVVDSHLKVYGTLNVRVVDASAVPLQISGHPTATLYAFAERAADLIKTDGAV